MDRSLIVAEDRALLESNFEVLLCQERLSPGKTDTRSDAMFDRLVQDAFDFMERAMASRRKDPKVSVIFFWTAVELFLKARLLREHWALVVVEPAEADLNKFQSADFQSVTYQNAVKRLKAIAGLRLVGSDNQCFEMLREHRNRVVHFCHEGYSDPPKKSVLVGIVIEQCRSWYYLHQWLCEKWKTEFLSYRDEIEKLQRHMQRHPKYLIYSYTPLISWGEEQELVAKRRKKRKRKEGKKEGSSRRGAEVQWRGVARRVGEMGLLEG